MKPDRARPEKATFAMLEALATLDALTDEERHGLRRAHPCRGSQGGDSSREGANMSSDEINEALTASGECANCGGCGTIDDDESGSHRRYACHACRETGHDPYAQLRATQAVGLLLQQLLEATRAR